MYFYAIIYIYIYIKRKSFIYLQETKQRYIIKWKEIKIILIIYYSCLLICTNKIRMCSESLKRGNFVILKSLLFERIL